MSEPYIVDPNGERWALRCTCLAHPWREHEARPLPDAEVIPIRRDEPEPPPPTLDVA